MSPTARIVKDLHVHKPVTKMLMTYTDNDDNRVATVFNMKRSEDMNQIIKTLRWASHHGVEVVFRPV